MHTHILSHRFTHTHVFTYLHMHTHTYTLSHSHIHTHTLAHTHAYMHTHMETHTQTQMILNFCFRICDMLGKYNWIELYFYSGKDTKWAH
jgi:hypothetical protein